MEIKRLDVRNLKIPLKVKVPVTIVRTDLFSERNKKTYLYEIGLLITQITDVEV
jgi:hypothetical protein